MKTILLVTLCALMCPSAALAEEPSFGGCGFPLEEDGLYGGGATTACEVAADGSFAHTVEAVQPTGSPPVGATCFTHPCARSSSSAGIAIDRPGRYAVRATASDVAWSASAHASGTTSGNAILQVNLLCFGTCAVVSGEYVFGDAHQVAVCNTPCDAGSAGPEVFVLEMEILVPDVRPDGPARVVVDVNIQAAADGDGSVTATLSGRVADITATQL